MTLWTTTYNNLEIPELELEKAKTSAEKDGVHLCQSLFNNGHIAEATFLQVMASELGMEYIPDLLEQILDENTGWSLPCLEICMFPLQWLRRHSIIPMYDEHQNLVLLINKPHTWLLNQEISLTLDKHVVRPIFTEQDSIEKLINIAFNEADTSNSNEILDNNTNIIDFDEDAINDVLDNTNEAPFIRFVNSILAQAIRMEASDIHIEPYRDFSKIRFRLDGVLYDRNKINKNHHPAIISRIKVMAKLDIAEKRLPQDGRIAIALGGRQVGLRVSTLPTSFGERVVLRLLEKNERVLSLVELGLSPWGLEQIQEFVKATHGCILVTGPTGSGKTTTLYAVLQAISSPNLNILTIEDPVEYELNGVGQVQVNTKIGLGFADGLRSLVRQDPDVILIGEIRDTETASIAVQSALTGHLVFSTLHTNDAPSAITRLLDMEVESFLLASVLRGIIAQRLVRVLCQHCKISYHPTESDLQALGQAREHFTEGQILYKAGACPECMETGYKGRIAIYEIMPVYESMKKCIVEKADATTLKQIAQHEGMQDLTYDGMYKVIQGITSLTEIARVTHL